MNVVSRVAGSRIAGKNYTDDTFLKGDLVPDFKLRFVGTLRDSAMWWGLLHPSSLSRNQVLPRTICLKLIRFPKMCMVAPKRGTSSQGTMQFIYRIRLINNNGIY
jgi:hypothetical protein